MAGMFPSGKIWQVVCALPIQILLEVTIEMVHSTDIKFGDLATNTD